MALPDYYATLGIQRTATQAEVKRAYRKLARKYHPDVSKAPDAEARFKEVAEAHEALIDAERRAAYDAAVQRHANGQDFEPPPGWDHSQPYRSAARGSRSGRQPEGGSQEEAPDFSDFFESLFGRGGPQGMPRRSADSGPMPGRDQHAKLDIGLEDSYLGAKRMFSIRMPTADAAGPATLQNRQFEVGIPKGVREGQHLRLAGLGDAGQGGAPAGDLYLAVGFLPHPLFRVSGGDISFELPVAPWEAALGASVEVPTPDHSVSVLLKVPPGSPQGRKLRLKGRGLPGKVPGDLYAVLRIVLPMAVSEADQEAYSALARAFPSFQPRAALEA